MGLHLPLQRQAYVTSNLEHRLDQHARNDTGYVAKRKPFQFVRSEEFAEKVTHTLFRHSGRAERDPESRGD